MAEPLLLNQTGIRRWPNPGQAFAHMLIAVLAVGIASSLPAGAEFILYRWWPKVAENADRLIASEIALAGALLLLLNAVRVAWENHRQARVADAAALVYAREKRGHLGRWRERRMLKQLPAARDAYVLTLTGFNTFADAACLLHGPLANAYEIRVMLLNPAAESARRRVDSLPGAVTLRTFAMEVESSIACLSELRMRGKNVTLKFYEREPFWKVVVLGDYVWVQYCHSGFEVKREPEYVFALNRASLRRGLFVPFYMYFLEQWNDTRHPHYDFDTHELVYMDSSGRETCRRPFGIGPDPFPAALPTAARRSGPPTQPGP